MVLTGMQCEGVAPTAAYDVLSLKKEFNIAAVVFEEGTVPAAELVLFHNVDVSGLLSQLITATTKYAIVICTSAANLSAVAVFLVRHLEWTLAHEHTTDGGALFLKKK